MNIYSKGVKFLLVVSHLILSIDYSYISCYNIVTELMEGKMGLQTDLEEPERALARVDTSKWL